MEVKANVQKRRQDRIRELQSRDAGSEGRNRFPAASGSSGSPPQERMKEKSLYIRGSHEYNHGGDPEVAWKEREKELLEWYSRPEGGSSVGPGGLGGGWSGSRTGGGGKAWKLFWVKAVIAAVLFAAVSLVFRMDGPWAAETKRYVRSALTEDMDFGQVSAWYSRTFSGAPSFLPAFGSKQEAAKVQAPVAPNRFVRPVKGKIAEAFSVKKQGMWIETQSGSHVSAMDEGRIEFAGQREETGYTVVIQHAEGYVTTYGGLKPAKWETGDWLMAGDVIGTAAAQTDGSSASRVFLSVMKDQRYVNPVEVVAFD